MPRTRKSHPPSLKAKVAVEAIKAHKTAAARRVLKALEKSPLTAGEVARMLNADPATCEAVLAELVRSGSVECDGDLGKKAIYRRKGAA